MEDTMLAGNERLGAALDELLKGKSTEEIAGPNGLVKQLTKALLERAMQAELSHRLGYEKGRGSGKAGGNGNSRNGVSRKRYRVTSARSRSPRRGTATEALSRAFCRSMSGTGRDSTTRFYRCTRGA